MAITATDIKYKLSVTTGPGNTNAQADPNLSLGEFMSSTEIVDATDNNLFDDVSGDENAASDVEYRLFFVHNDHGSLPWTTVVAWLSAEVSGGAVVAIAVDDTAASAEDSASAQAEEVGNESTAPTGPSFAAPTTKGAGVAIGTIASGFVRGIWVRRSAANTVALDADGVTIRCEGDTAA